MPRGKNPDLIFEHPYLLWLGFRASTLLLRKALWRVLVHIFMVLLKSWLGQGLALYIFIFFWSSFSSNKQRNHLHFNWVILLPLSPPKHSLPAAETWSQVSCPASQHPNCSRATWPQNWKAGKLPRSSGICPCSSKMLKALEVCKLKSLMTKIYCTLFPSDSCLRFHS